MSRIPRRLRALGASVFLAIFTPATFLPAEPLGLREILERTAVRVPGSPHGASITVAELETGANVFERNPDTPITIASVTKMISSAAALHFLGPDYKFKTTFWRRGEIREGILSGSLLVVGGGDPNISGRFYNDDFNAIFDRWAEGLRRAGITRVAGDLILNSTRFDSVARHPDWPAGQESRWYQAPISALSYNDNVVLVSIRPGSRPGRPVSITIDPPNDLLRPLSRARTVRRGRPRVAVGRSLGSSVVTVSGTVPVRRAWWSTPIAIDEPPKFFGSALTKRLEAAGIEVVGKIVENGVQPDASWTLVATTESELIPTLAVSNKRSQSFYAEQIFKTLAAEKTGKGTWDAAVGLAKQFLLTLGLDPSRYQLRDGSGLSSYNRVSSADMVRFLVAMDHSPQGPLWKSTLAVNGDGEGSLRHRLRTPDLAGKVLAKTGSLKGVSTLAGYVTAASGRVYAFAILLNGRRVWDSSGHAFQDRFVRALVQNG
jgi:D-alanyl-D-alanine carboxypeptidase/D-alanyl-D-alanine-endopeptidase (penicillin-binding protein 4)